MRPRHSVGLVLLALGCGKTEPATRLEQDLETLTACNPLQDSALEASLAEPLGVGRTRAGTVYAVTRVGSTSFAWRSLGDQLIAYPVYQENSALGATIYGVQQGSEGFALTLRPEGASTSVRLFTELEDAMAREGSSSTTGGTLLELLEPAALEGFEVATAVSPAQIVGPYAGARSLTGPMGDLFLVRPGAGAASPLAVFYGGVGFRGGANQMLERRVIEELRLPDGSLDLTFELYDETATLHVDATGEPGLLRVGSRETGVGRGGVAPVQLAQLEFQCREPMRTDWVQTASPSPLASASCAEPERIEFCLETASANAGLSTREDGSQIRELEAAQVTEIGNGLPPDGGCSRLGQVLPAAEQARIVWARLRHTSGDVWLAAAIDEPSLPVRVGDTLSIRSSQGPFHWGGERSELRARSADDELLLWLGRATRPAEFQDVPEFEFSFGPEACVRDLDCGLGAIQHALDSWRIDGDAAHVGYGEALRQGPFRVHNAATDRITQLACADVPMSGLTAAVWRSSAY